MVAFRYQARNLGLIKQEKVSTNQSIKTFISIIFHSFCGQENKQEERGLSVNSDEFPRLNVTK